VTKLAKTLLITCASFYLLC